MAYCGLRDQEIGIGQLLIHKVNNKASFTAQSEAQAKEGKYNKWLEIDNVLLHEIAHALTPDNHHYLPWKRCYAELLYDHFGELVTRQCLSDCEFCCTKADQLINEMTSHNHTHTLPASY